MTKRAKLDMSRPYGAVHGSGAGHRYEQDGKFFDHSGDQCNDDGSPLDDVEAPPAADAPEEKAFEDMSVKELNAAWRHRGQKSFPPGMKPPAKINLLKQHDAAQREQLTADQ